MVRGQTDKNLEKSDACQVNVYAATKVVTV